MKRMCLNLERMVLLGTGVVFLLLLLTSCAYVPRWTPEAVSPPASLQIALAEAKQVLAEGRAALTAEQGTTVTLTRDGAILTALARNRSLAVEQFAPGISATYVPEARAAFDPNLLATASYGRDTQPVTSSGNKEPNSVVSREFQSSARVTEFLPTGTEVFLSGGILRSRSSSSDWKYTGSWSVGVNQSLLRGAGLDVNLVTLRQAKNAAAISQHILRGFVINLARQVDNAYWELVLAYETLKIRQFAVQLAEEQLAMNRDYISVGKLSPDAEVSAKAELASRQADLVDAEADVKTRTIELIRLLNPEHEFQWALTFQPVDPPAIEQVDVNPGISARLADLYRPELAQVRLDLANRDLEVIQTRNGLLPKLDAFASYGRLSSGASYGGATRYLDDSNFDNYEVGLSLEMAPFNRAERARYQRAQFEQKQSEATIKNLEQILEADVRSAVIEVQRQWERIPATQEEVRSRQKQLSVEQDRFRVGKSTTLDVLQVHRDLIQAQVDEVTARIRYIQSLTALYHTEGTLLDRRGIGTKTE